MKLFRSQFSRPRELPSFFPEVGMPMRALSPAAVVTVAATVALLSAPATAYADGAGGTLELYDAASGEELPDDGSAVCSFYLALSGFEGRRVGWKVVEESSGTVAETDAVALDGDGNGRSEELSLRDGRYRLVWDFEGGGATEHRVFDVECDGLPEGDAQDVQDGGSGSSESAESRHGAENGTEVTREPSGQPEAPTEQPPVPSPAGTDAAGPEGGSHPSAEPSAGGDLAETGSQVPAGALATAGASLLGAGAYLVLRRREGRSQRR